MARLYEDLTVGEVFSFAEHTVSEEEMEEFARQYDPQPIHLSEKSTADTASDSPVASGWLIAALSMRFLVETALEDIAITSGLGVDELRWNEPVHAGDELTGEAEIISKSLDKFDSNHGTVGVAVEITNQDGTTVTTYTTHSMVRCGDL
jgi:acyl dehydratase